MKKVVLAYSGGLDTSYCVKYLSEEMGLEVYTALVNTGGFTPGELAEIEEKAYALGVKKHVTLDVTGEYYEKCIRYMIFGNVLRNKTYPVSVSSERTFQALAIVRYAKEIGADMLPDLFRKNPYMEKIYPDVRSHSALTVFKIYEGTGEWFDLSKLPIERASFTFGGAQAKETGYFVTDKCNVESSRGSRALYRLQALLLQMSAEVYRHFKKACGYSARTLSALRKLL